MKSLLFLCFVVVDVLGSYPYSEYMRSPQRTVMFGGYYGHPLQGSSYIPQGSMSFAAGDTIATNSFAGERPFDVQTSAEETTEKRTSNNYDDELEIDSSANKPRRIPKKKPAQEDDDDDDDDLPANWPFNSGRNVPSYNAFFPIMFGGSSALGRKSEGGANDGFYPGSATAIANSFSTGKGGVATSHATSFGDPYLSTLFRNGNFNKKGVRPGQTEN